MQFETELELDLVRRRRARSAAAVGAAAILALSACGSDDSDASADAEEPATAGTSPEEPLAADAMVEIFGWEVTVSDIRSMRRRRSSTTRDTSRSNRTPATSWPW